MTAVRCVVVGAGGLGRGVLDLIEIINAAENDGPIDVVGVLDDSPSELDLERLAVRGYPWLGPATGASPAQGSTAFVLAINSPTAKEDLSESLCAAGLEPLTLIHPSVDVPATTSLGVGVVLFGGTQLSSNVTVGPYVTVNRNVVLGHDTVISAFTSINPGAVVAGETVVGRGNLVGANSVLLRGVSTGVGVTVGALACVTKDVPDDSVAVGIPARW